jgi:hypothetical protein
MKESIRSILQRNADDKNISELWKNAQSEIVKLRDVIDYYQQQARENGKP